MPSWTSADLKAYENKLRRPLRDSQPERHQAPALGGAIPGETGGLPKIIVRFVGYRVKPLDPDNFAGSVKDLLDGIRHAGLLHGRDDDPTSITLETSQVRVGHLHEERTLVEIEYP